MHAWPGAGTLVVLNGGVIACSGDTRSRTTASAKPSVYEVRIDNFSFTPPPLTVPAGAKVMWTKRDDLPHNIVSSEQKFKSKPLDADEAYAFTFTEPGTYH
jgi:plastocyanin